MNKLPLGKIFGTIFGLLFIVVATSLGLNVAEQKAALHEALTIIEANSGTIQELSGKVNELTIAQETQAELTTGEVVEEAAAPVTTVAVCTFKPQPTQAPGDYSGNTAALNAYAVENPCVLPQGSYTTITFELAKPLAKADEIHTRFKDTNIYGKLTAPKGEQTFVYDLNPIVTARSKGNLAEYLLKKDVHLSTYVAMFDGNYITAIYLD